MAAGPVRTALAALLDLLLVCCSLGVSSLVSAALVCALPLRQTLGQRLMRIYPVEEVGDVQGVLGYCVEKAVVPRGLCWSAAWNQLGCCVE